MRKLLALSIALMIIGATITAYSAITYTVNMNALEQLTINCVAIYNPDFSVQKYQVSITGISHDTDTTGRRYPRASTMTYAQLGVNQKTKVKDLLYIFYAGNQVAIGEAVGELPPLE